MAGTTTEVKRVGDILLERGMITQEQIEQALAEQKARDFKQLLGEVIIDLGFCTEEQVTEALADAYDVPYAKLDDRLIDPRVVTSLPSDFIRKHVVIPLFKVDGVLTAAVHEPTNMFVIEEMGRHFEGSIQIVAATRNNVQELIDQFLPDDNVVVIGDLMDEAGEQFTDQGLDLQDISKLEDLSEDSPAVKLVNYIIGSAVQEGASDIHIEPGEKSLRVRYRIDGQLSEKLHPPPALQQAIVARLKIMASLDISERRLPQDGAIRVMMGTQPIDLRLSTLPNKFGEKAVLRIIDNRNILVDLKELGFHADVLKRFREIIRKPHGLILVTGPTGSGKSTTLYSVLSEIASPEINISTVEDPVEFNLSGINQFQVHEKIDFTFATALRALLRQDPDVLMIGEIRDPETAKIAVQAALTGHLVLSTLHTNDSAAAVTRLQNLSVEPYLISASLICVVAQRLVRKLCPACRVEAEIPPNIAHTAERLKGKLDRMYEPKGCTKCRDRGYAGRIGLYEVLPPDDEIRDAISAQANLNEIRALAAKTGVRTVLEDGLYKVNEGLTTIEEVFRVTTA